MAKYKATQFFIKSDLYNNWLGAYFKINDLLDENKEIPIALLKDFFSLMIYEPVLSAVRQKNHAESIITKAMDYFSKIKAYDFNSDQYTFKELISKCVNVYFKHKEKQDLSKDQTIFLFYVSLSLIKSNLTPKHREQFTFYKKAVIAAYLTYVAGYKLFSKNNPSTKNLFQASRNALNDVNF